MRYYQILISIFVLLLLTNCVGVQPQTSKINSNKIIENIDENIIIGIFLEILKKSLIEKTIFKSTSYIKRN